MLPFDDFVERRNLNGAFTMSQSNNSLLLRPREAATALSISERTLWSLTAPRGPISSVRLGGCVRYSTNALQAYIDSQVACNARTLEPSASAQLPEN